ncbi:bifunctional 5-dehydro-2-deoxygluconokinase/5-dehydro-2-deoxyphosphogluconate aldolase [Spiribacter halobius]|uniref:5-dehydro-2-deoxygluconokinase n=1 Tax=Sediminicurvatus halobius TaxID=2182432 RepID=A0A2U2N7J2_9GAMM|nr:5-dehydro-2-deoxygluconokinase [Spiribacter halobius]PWG64954.1 5-dehydro-2-deoxygluconokinase [Spiribacter halobius]UEX78189.1 5-dehydro-2-deoxygluconokinase [Spiribacter halobius]
MTDRPLDVICLGRAVVDLYGEQIGSRLEDMQSLRKYVGGSSLNIATGCARQGLRAAMLTRVGDEHMGRFVRERLAAEGVDTSHVVTDPERLTGLVVLGIKDRDTFPLIFFRENCADMAVSPEDFDADFIASARALLITGTHFSTPHVDHTSRTAVAHMRAAGGRCVLDIDYRPVLWGLTGHGAGEERFVAARSVTEHLQRIVPLFDLIVGTEEEIHIAGGETDTVAALQRLRALTDAVLVVKRGACGCSVFEGAIPDTLDDGITVPGVPVEVLNVLGAGDAFMAGFLRGYLGGDSWTRCGHYANACGALVVSRHGCTPAMPTRAELDDYLARADAVPRPDRDARLNYLHRVTVRHRQWPEVCALAFDHRSQFEAMAAEAGASVERIPALKGLIARAAREGAAAEGLAGSAGVLVDGRFGARTLEQLTGEGLWIGRPVELPGSRPLAFEAGDNVGLDIATWPAEQVVKCLLFYHPDDPVALRAEQDRRVTNLYEACVRTDHELLLEVIPPADLPADDRTVARVLDHFYDLGVYPDWWKLQPPGTAAWREIGAVIEARDPYCRGVLLLGLDAPADTLAEGFRAAAAQRWCRGFAVGRSIFGEPARKWLAGELDDAGLVAAVTGRYRDIVRLWQQARAATGAPQQA